MTAVTKYGILILVVSVSGVTSAAFGGKESNKVKIEYTNLKPVLISASLDSVRGSSAPK